MHVNPLYAVLYVALGMLVIYRVVYKQLRGTTLTRKSLVTIPIILVAVGVFTSLDALRAADTDELVLLGIDIVVLAVLGLFRSASTKLTASGDTTFQKGSWVTLVLWLATIGARVAFAFIGGSFGASGALSSASIMLTLGVSIGAQNALTYYRIQQRGLPLAADAPRTLGSRR